MHVRSPVRAPSHRNALMNTLQLPTLVPTIVRGAVRGLLCLGRPAAVGWLVVPVSVDAVQARAFRALPHVGQEVQKAAPGTRVPAGAHRDPTASIARPANVAFVSASPEHGNPTAVRRSFGESVRANPRDILLNRAGGADLGLRLLARDVRAATSVMARHKPTGAAVVNSNLLSTTTGAKGNLQVQPAAVAADVGGSAMAVRGDRKVLPAAALAKPRNLMPTQQVWLSVTKQLVGRNLSAAATSASNHRVQFNTQALGGQQ